MSGAVCYEKTCIPCGILCPVCDECHKCLEVLALCTCNNPAQDEYRNHPPKQAPMMGDIAGYSNAEL